MDDNVDLDLVSICEEVDDHHGVLDDAHDHHLLATIASVRSMMGVPMHPSRTKSPH